MSKIMLEATNNHEKQPYKIIEIPLSKFKDEVIPHHWAQLKVHRDAIEKSISSNNYEDVQKYTKVKNQALRQLKNLIYELDTLRDQVRTEDLDRFNSCSTALKEEIRSLLQDYIDLEVQIFDASKTYEDDHVSDKITSDNCQLSLEGFVDLNLYDEERRLKRVEALNKDIEDVHEIFNKLQECTVQQGELVNKSEDNIVTTKDNARSTLKQLIMASKLNVATYPVSGACIGTLIGGPIGSLAGLKIGAVAAISCAIVGYVGGKVIKKKRSSKVNTKEIEMLDQTSDTTNDDKKSQ